MDEFNIIKFLMLDKYEVQYGKITICDLHNYRGYAGLYRYQVYSTDSACKFVDNYKNLDLAITKFLELKGLAKAKVR